MNSKVLNGMYHCVRPINIEILIKCSEQYKISSQAEGWSSIHATSETESAIVSIKFK